MEAPLSVKRPSWSVPALLLQCALLAGLLALPYRHVINGLIYTWSHNGDWSHGFIIPLFSLYFLYTQRHRFPRDLLDRGWLPNLLGALILSTALVVLVASIFIKTEYPKKLALVMSIMGVVLMVWGWPITRWSWFAVAFLIFAMPLPQRVYQEVTLPLRHIAAAVSASMLSVLPGMVAEPQGTVVEYMYHGEADVLDIERACSGMRLLMTMMALGVAMAFMYQRPAWQRLVMILSCVPIAIFCNIVRVTTTGFMVVLGRRDLAHGTWHTLLGLGMLVIAFSLYGSISYVLNHLYVEEEDRAGEAAVSQGGAA